MAELLLEIGTEELPASASYSAVAQIEAALPALLERARLSFGPLRVLATPRRLAVFVGDIPESAEPEVVRRRGPSMSAARGPDGEWTSAAVGFARSQGVEPDALEVEETAKGPYLLAVTRTPGLDAMEVLPGVLSELVSNLRFGRSMRWGDGETRFSRPVRWLLALLGEKVVGFEYGGLSSSNTTFGHRYLSQGPLRILCPEEYEKVLSDAFVVVDHATRREAITESCRRVCEEAGMVPVLHQEVLDEVVMLVEWPGVVLGRFEEKYLELPAEVLEHAMEAHQRYFPVRDAEGALSAGFLAVHNGNPAFADTIRTGHQRVLAARLADARFFFTEDLKRALADRVKDLEHVVYQSELGSMAEKSQRLVTLVAGECDSLGLEGDVAERVARAAALAKCDLVTHMVIEFTDLQGTVGSIYARLTGEEPAVAAAIGELYLPRRLGDALPVTLEGALLSLAEKADNLAASFGLGHVPTGSEDPYALRRQALGMTLILLDRGLELSANEMVGAAARALQAEAHGFDWTQQAQGAFEEFFTGRERVFFTDAGYRYDLVEAALARDWDRPVAARRRLEALVSARESGLLARLYTAYERCYNLSKGSETGPVNAGLLSQDSERTLFSVTAEVEEAMRTAVEGGDPAAALQALEPLCAPVDRLFDEVLIMDEDPAVRANRLSLLKRVTALFEVVAEFSRLTWD
ncbi:MAG: glycine--tRNA ligase subunit beta [Actinobacteria bacterium]|nr:glycine--tRNA ligase subunit beta [Actinomycetota bacterium]MBU1943701.1 glycine--tRNA ligase subunit beta [Actinomycetota bacterium]MBU2686155.1 glycine--tRNA ligase subunit beta [Actinomycetota bacterium]